MIRIPVFLLLVILAGAVASVEKSHNNGTVATLLSRSKELVQDLMTVWWVPPFLSALFIISMHAWVYGIAHIVWFITSLFTSRVHVKQRT